MVRIYSLKIVDLHGSSRSSAVHHHHVKLRSILLGSQSFTIQAPFSDIAEGLTLVNLLCLCVSSGFHRSSVINPYEARKTAAAALVLPNTASGVIPSTLISPVKGQILILCVYINLGLVWVYLEKRFTVCISSPVKTSQLAGTVSSTLKKCNTVSRCWLEVGRFQACCLGLPWHTLLDILAQHVYVLSMKSGLLFVSILAESPPQFSRRNRLLLSFTCWERSFESYTLSIVRKSKFFGFSNHVICELDIFFIERRSKFSGFSNHVIYSRWKSSIPHFSISLSMVVSSSLSWRMIELSSFLSGPSKSHSNVTTLRLSGLAAKSFWMHLMHTLDPLSNIFCDDLSVLSFIAF